MSYKILELRESNEVLLQDPPHGCKNCELGKPSSVYVGNFSSH